MNKWSLVGLLSSLAIVSLAHAGSAPCGEATHVSTNEGASWSSPSRAAQAAVRPRRAALQLGGLLPCVAPQLVRGDQGIGAFQNVPAEGGTFTLLIMANAAEQCGLGISESSEFIVDLQGSGATSRTYTVLANTGAARTAVLVGSSGVDATSSFEVRQAAAAAPATGSSAWSNDTSVLGEPRTCGNVALTVVKSGATLKPDTWVLSPSKNYRLVYQTDGNLVLYKGTGEFVWNNSKLTPGGQVRMQGDGNLVSYDAKKRPQWSSKTQAFKGAYLAVQDDGNVVVYSPGGCVARWAIR